jgi:cyanuric acid amidohydrolase
MEAMTEVHWFDMAHPADYAGLQALIGDAASVARLAVLVKTEGHTATNDFARQLSRLSLDPMLAPWSAEGRAVAVLANGCEGVATPGGYAFIDRRSPGGDGPADGLRFGIARSAALPADAIGEEAAIDLVAACVAAACADARLAPAEAALAILKCPTLLASRCPEAPHRSDQHRGRAIAALGAAVALGEIGRERIEARAIAADPELRSAKAMTFAGPEQPWIEAIVLGHGSAEAGAGTGAPHDGLRVGVCHPRDMLDAASIRRLLLSLGLHFDDAGELVDPERVLAVLGKAGPTPDGRVRGARTGVFTSAYSADSNMRAAQSGLLGGLFGSTRFFVSGDPVQQAPPGGGVVAVIVKAPP